MISFLFAKDKRFELASLAYQTDKINAVLNHPIVLQILVWVYISSTRGNTFGKFIEVYSNELIDNPVLLLFIQKLIHLQFWEEIFVYLVNSLILAYNLQEI